jgi:hypothetical protein
MFFVSVIYLHLLSHIKILLGICFQTLNKITILYRMTKESPYPHLIYHVDLYVHSVHMVYSVCAHCAHGILCMCTLCTWYTLYVHTVHMVYPETQKW